MNHFRDMGNRKLQQLVDTAWNLFWRFGFSRVSIEEICKDSGISKMTFYKHFRNKTELVRFLMLEVSQQSIKMFEAILDKDIPFTEKIAETIKLKLEQTENISEAFFYDVHRLGDSELHRIIQDQMAANMKVVTNWYVDAQSRGEVRQDIKPEFIIYFLNHIVDMAKDEKLKRLYQTSHDLIRELTNFFFYGLLPAENRHNIE